MGLTFDGDRSRKMLWFVRKMIRDLRMLNLQTKALVYNGFFLRAWRSGDIFGGHAAAPMGAVVLYSTIDGVSVMTADSWKSGFTGRQYMNALFKNLTSGTSVNLIDRVPEEDMIAAGFLTIPATPILTGSWYNVAPGGFIDGTSYVHRDANPSPVVIPVLAGEAFWTNLSGNLFVDVNGDDIQDSPPYRQVQDSSMTFYSSDGSGLNNRRTIVSEEASTIGIPSGVVTLLPSVELAAVRSHSQDYSVTGGHRYAAMYYTGSTDGLLAGYFMLSTLTANMPAGLQSAIHDVPADSSAWIHGNLAFSTVVDGYPTLLHSIDLTNSQASHATSSEVDWFEDNDYDWALSFHFNTIPSSTVYSVPVSQFLSLLDFLAQNVTMITGGVVDWNLAVYMFNQLFPRPNSSFSTPHDSVMFNAEDGNVYTWTRYYNSTRLGQFGSSDFNAFKFTHTGLFVTEIVIPTVVTDTDGIRPTITYAGDSLYLCVCESLEPPLRVHEIHVGSPFTAWTEIPVPTGTDNLVHVRPVRVKLNDIVLLGVIEDAEGLYYFAFLKYTNGSGEWVRMGQIPVIRPDVYPDEVNWSIGVFGKGEFSIEIPQYLSQPTATTQMPIGPYSGYTRGMP